MSNKEKMGLDDYVVVHGEDALTQLVEEAEPAIINLGSGFFVQDGRFVERVPNRRKDGDGFSYHELTNFTAQIAEETRVTDEINDTVEFRIRGQLHSGGVLPPITVSAEEFQKMRWVIERWGGRVIMDSRHSTPDKVRQAIQLHSGQMARREVFPHTGWREVVNGDWVYLHGNRIEHGAELEGPLVQYRLPREPRDVQQAIQISLEILELGPDEVTVPLLAAIYLAPLSHWLTPDFALYLVGPSGSLKSTIGALALCHYGTFEHSSLPESFESTANAIARTTWLAKDVLLLVDDAYGSSDSPDQRRMQTAVQTVVRSIGNRSQRNRLRADATQGYAYAPRGLVVLTGEDYPSGTSTRARCLFVELEREQIDLERLTCLQGRANHLPHALAGFIDWLRGQLPGQLPGELKEMQGAIYKALGTQGRHLRQGRNLAKLLVGFHCFLSYARDVGVVDEVRFKVLTERAHRALLTIGQFQDGLNCDVDPIELFFTRLRAMRFQGKVYLSDEEGGRSGGDRIGWADDEYAYLISDAVYSALNAFLPSDQRFPVTKRRLATALKKAGLLVDCAKGRNTAQVRDPQEKNRRVWKMSLNLLNEDEVDLPEGGES